MDHAEVRFTGGGGGDAAGGGEIAIAMKNEYLVITTNDNISGILYAKGLKKKPCPTRLLRWPTLTVPMTRCEYRGGRLLCG